MKPCATTRDAKTLAATKQKIAEVADQIRAGEFSPKPGFSCGYCDFKPLCPAHEQLINIQLRSDVPAKNGAWLSGNNSRAKQKTGQPISRPVFYFEGFSIFEAWIGSAHELLWNFSPRERASHMYRARIASFIYKCRGE